MWNAATSTRAPCSTGWEGRLQGLLSRGEVQAPDRPEITVPERGFPARHAGRGGAA